MIQGFFATIGFFFVLGSGIAFTLFIIEALIDYIWNKFIDIALFCRLYREAKRQGESVWKKAEGK